MQTEFTTLYHHIAIVESQTKKVSQYILVCVRLDLKMKVNVTWHLCFTLLKNKYLINENRHLKWKLYDVFQNVNKCHYLYFMIMFHGRVHSSHWHQAWVWQIVTLISLYYVWLPRLLLSLCGNQALGDTRSHDARPELVQLECVIVLWKLSFEVDANSIVPLFALGGGNNE